MVSFTFRLLNRRRKQPSQHIETNLDEHQNRSERSEDHNKLLATPRIEKKGYLFVQSVAYSLCQLSYLGSYLYE
jgi:hypothetical protein